MNNVFKSVSVLLIIIMLFGAIQPVFADSVSVNEIIFDDDFGAGYYTNGWGNFSVVKDNSSAKNGRSSLKFSIAAGGSHMCAMVINNTPVDVSAENLDDVALKMWINLPDDDPIPTFILYTQDDTGMMQSVIPLQFYVDNKDRGKWTRLQIPLSEISENGRYDNGTYGKTNFKRFVGIAFKCNSGGLSRNFTAFFDDVAITSDFSHSNDTHRLKSLGGDAVTPEVYEENGKTVYAKLFSDSVGSAVTSGSTWGYDRRYKTEGFASLRTVVSAGGARTAEFKLKTPIYIPEETLKNSALYFDIKADESANLNFILITANKDAYKLTSYIPLKEYTVSQSEWTTIAIPYDNLPYTGTTWYDESEVYVEKGIDWTKITGFGISADTSAYSSDSIIYIDNVRIAEKPEQISVKPSVLKLSEEEFKNYPQNFTTISIKAQANRDFRDETAYDGEGGWIDQGAEDLRGFKLKGVNEFLGIPFDITDPSTNDNKGCIVLQGQNRKGFVNSVTVPVGKSAKSVYFLHSAAWIDTTHAGDYIVEYNDGSKVTIPITKNAEIADWGADFKSDVAATAYRCWNENGQYGGFGVFAWKNPNPQKVIENIRLTTPGYQAFIMLAGITLSDNEPAIISQEEEKVTYPDEIINPDTTDWFPITALADTKILEGSPLDVSWALDAPAGKHGYITRQGENFVFEDGKKIRFWGCDVVANCVFLEKEKTDDLVRQIAASGYNLVRFHHMDADWIERNIFGVRGVRNTTRKLDSVSLDRFEYFWSELKKRGIYIMVDPSCDRRLYANDLGADRAGWAFKSSAVAYEELQMLQKEYAEQLFTHVNPYTGTALKDDPTLALVDIINEDSLFWTNAMYWGMAAGRGKDIIDAEFTVWLKDKYGSDDKLRAAWTEEGKTGLPENESLSDKVTVAAYFNLDGNVNLSSQKVTDTRYFISVFMQRYYEKMLDFYRNELGIKAMICGSNAPTFPEVCDLYSQTACGADFVDQHYYFGGESTHYFTSGMSVMNLADSMIDSAETSLIDILQKRKVVNTPYVISEWNMVEPLVYSVEGTPIMAAYSSFLNFSPIVFAFAQDYVTGPYMGISFDTREVPTKAAVSYVSGLMAVRGDVSESETGYYETITRDAAASTINYQYDIPVEVRRIAKTGVALVDNGDQTGDLSKSNIALREYAAKMLEKTGKLTSVNGQLRTDMKNNIFEINTAKTQGYIGKIGGTTGVLDNMNVNIDNAFGVVTLTSLSYDDIDSAEKLLLTTVARWRNTGTRYSSDGQKMLVAGENPMIAEPVTGYVDIKTNGKYSVYCLDQSGQRIKEARTEDMPDGMTRIYLDKDNKCFNYEIVKSGVKGEFAFEKPSWYNEPVGENYFGFSDADSAEWAKDMINYMLYKGVVKTDNGYFYPNAFAASADIEEWVSKATDLTDFSVPQSERVTRGEFFLSAARALQNKGALNYAKAKDADFSDAGTIGQELGVYIPVIYGMGLISGDENNRLNASEYITRAEVIAFLSKLQK